MEPKTRRTQKTKSTKPRVAPKAKAKTASPSDGLFEHVVKLTGLPGNAVKKELKALLDKKNIDVNQLTLEQLRSVVASYLREIMMGILERNHSRGRHDRHH